MIHNLSIILTLYELVNSQRRQQQNWGIHYHPPLVLTCALFHIYALQHRLVDSSYVKSMAHLCY